MDAPSQPSSLSTHVTPPSALTPFEPHSFADLIDFAKQLAESSLVPPAYQKKPQNIVVAVGMGKALGLSAFQSIQEIMVVNGKPSLYGGTPKALVENSGLLEQFVELAPHEALQKGYGECTVKRKGRNAVTRRFSKEDAERAGLWAKDTWKGYPGRMLMYRARSWALNDEFSDVLKGLKIAEEVIDMEQTPTGSFAMPQPVTTAPEQPGAGDAGADTPIDPQIVSTPSDADKNAAEDDANAPHKPISGEKRVELFRFASANKVKPAQLREELARMGVPSTDAITNAVLPQIKSWIEKQKPA